MAVWYLDNDDEITDAVARLRNATDEQVVFVVPTGSRIATGRINFKLLGREAAARGLRLAIASPDAQVRAMAASAGVLGLATAARPRLPWSVAKPPPEPDGAGPPRRATTEAETQRVAARRRAAVPASAPASADGWSSSPAACSRWPSSAWWRRCRRCPRRR